MKTIPYGRQYITDEDINAVVETLHSDYLTQGPRIKDFENVFAQYCHADYCVMVSNGTAALHLAAMALDIKPGDKVITTPITFVASANGFSYCGAEIVFCDIDPKTYLLDLNKLESILELSPKGTYKGIVPVDFAGYPIHAEKLRKIADKYGLWIVEDACHAPGGWFIDSNG
jgi:dTDP-4-amino-4,6-dideoxygalactose transaminase